MTKIYEQSRMRLSDIGSSTPNRGFFVGKVCDCEPDDKGHIRWGKVPNNSSPTGWELTSTGSFDGRVQPNIHEECGLYAYNNLRVCTRCTSVFYKQFHHPATYMIFIVLKTYPAPLAAKYYIDELDKRFSLSNRISHGFWCWHCLESLQLNPDLPRIPPISELLPPKITPLSVEELADKMLADFEAFMKEMEG